ncbi:Mariner transposase [Caligus rogercresseyi]|uniref:Mariner transposase n=1 Tax=Caligus rogercresseyi TaxID=217165 RepID=A0A7T8GNC1_CALRO|nr:Mariner transposase [Caligus rogercresseyi]
MDPSLHPESKRSSFEWTATVEPRPKAPESTTIGWKGLASVFWDMRGLIFIDYLRKEIPSTVEF